jgi:pyruvate/2-oxoglutarate dehydrogenase complex dihydrolipoamide acyltransferase (E2) component
MLFVVCPFFMASLYSAPPTLETFLTIPGKFDPKTIPLDELQQKVLELINTPGETKAHKILINNVVQNLTRTEGWFSYGTKIKKKILYYFLLLFQGVTLANNPEINTIIDPGVPSMGKIEYEDDQSPISVTLSFSGWLDFLSSYYLVNDDEPGDYCIENPITIYREWKEAATKEAEQKAEAARLAEEKAKEAAKKAKEEAEAQAAQEAARLAQEAEDATEVTEEERATEEEHTIQQRPEQEVVEETAKPEELAPKPSPKPKPAKPKPLPAAPKIKPKPKQPTQNLKKLRPYLKKLKNSLTGLRNKLEMLKNKLKETRIFYE